MFDIFTKKIQKQNLDFVLYIAGLIGALFFALVYLCAPETSCLFLTITGYKCPGCGGSHALMSLLEGNIFRAFRLNFLAVILVLYYAIFMLAYSFHLFTSKKTPYVHFHISHIYIGVFVLLAQTIYNLVI